MPFTFKKAEHRIVNVDDIVEFPTCLGSKCLLLKKLGLNAYLNTEEEILEALTESANNPEFLEICLKSSRCSVFWEKFSQGITPFMQYDPVYLHEYNGRYWAVEGKHRVCLAKRAGVKKLEALVWTLEEDTESLLPKEGKPGRFKFCYSYIDPPKARGEKVILWIKSSPEVPLRGLENYPLILDERFNTKGEFITIFQGLRFRVSVTKAKDGAKKILGLFLSQTITKVETEVIIDPDHKKTKIWLLKVPAEEDLFSKPLGMTDIKTVYRYGCWRRCHFKWLNSICVGFFQNV